MTAQAWYCTWCGDAHPLAPGYAPIDPRYGMVVCSGVARPAIRDQRQATFLAQTQGKFRPKDPQVVDAKSGQNMTGNAKAKVSPTKSRPPKARKSALNPWAVK